MEEDLLQTRRGLYPAESARGVEEIAAGPSLYLQACDQGEGVEIEARPWCVFGRKHKIGRRKMKIEGTDLQRSFEHNATHFSSTDNY
jgi:hypothetical protein